MSLWESGESSGAVSLQEVFGGWRPDGVSARAVELEGMAFLMCRGGWPGAVGQSGRAALRHAFDYVDGVAESDISRVDGVGRDAERARVLMRSYARLQASQAGIGVIAADLSGHEGMLISENTIYSYLNALREIFVIEDVGSWHPNLRRKTTMRTSDTRYFTDPSIATAVMGLGPSGLMDDLTTFGLFFETMVVRDLRTYSAALGGELLHYHDRNGLECDGVVRLRDGQYGLVEVKLGGEALIRQGCDTLRKLSEIIDTTKMRAPAFRMVVTAVGRYAYTRADDGVIVCPVTALRE